MSKSTTFRRAEATDIKAIVELIWNDGLRQADSVAPDPDQEKYLPAFYAIAADPNQYLVIAENEQGEVVATCQLTVIPYLAFFDKRLQVEYVRVSPAHQGKGVGRELFDWIESYAREQKVSRIQLTTDKRRQDAQAFYKALGYEATHEGMKFKIN